jgi:hypothetical protein
MIHQNPFARDKDIFAPVLIKERLLVGLFAATACAGTFSPVLWPYQNNSVKLIQQLYGLFSAVSFTVSAYTRKQKEQTYQAIGNANHKIVTEHLKGIFAYEQSRQQIESKRDLASYVNSLPMIERDRWVRDYGLHGLVDIPQMQEAVIEQQPMQLPSSGISIPYPDISGVNEDMVQSIINPSPMAKIQAIAEQYPEYIRIDNGKWIDDLCDSASLHNMSDRANHHFMLVGGTQSGKSTLAGIIINKIAAQSHGPAIVLGSDPKDPGTRWLCRFSRKFDGIKQLPQWITFATKVIESRKEDVANNGGSTDGIPELFLLQDEVDTVYNGGKKSANLITKETVDNLQSLWFMIAKFTAAFKCHGIFIGQSPLSEATGFSRPNIKNLCFIALGQMSSYILGNPKDFVNVKPDVLEALNLVCELLNKDNRRYALVVPTKGNPYVALIPQFDIESLKQNNTTTPPQPQSSQENDWYRLIKEWSSKLNRRPSKEELRAQWENLTGIMLNDKGISHLMEMLGFGSDT